MSSQEFQKTVDLAELYDFYKNLLTQKQIEYFELYFFEDLTLQEIAEEFSISRNAVYDSISKTSATLVSLEEKLKLKYKSEKLREILENGKKENISKEQLILEVEKTF